MNRSCIAAKSYTGGITSYQNDNINTGRISYTGGITSYQNDNINTGRISYTSGITCYQTDNINTGRITCTPGAGCYQNDNINAGRISYTSGTVCYQNVSIFDTGGVKSGSNRSVASRSRIFDTGRGITCYQNDNINTRRISYTTGVTCYQNDNIYKGGNGAHHAEVNVGTSGATHHAEAQSGTGGTTHHAEALSDTTGITHHAEVNVGTGGATFGCCFPKFSHLLPEPVSGSFVLSACYRAFQSYFFTEVSS